MDTHDYGSAGKVARLIAQDWIYGNRKRAIECIRSRPAHEAAALAALVSAMLTVQPHLRFYADEPGSPAGIETFINLLLTEA